MLLQMCKKLSCAEAPYHKDVWVKGGKAPNILTADGE
jgi:hypothetical protein